MTVKTIIFAKSRETYIFLQDLLYLCLFSSSISFVRLWNRVSHLEAKKTVRGTYHLAAKNNYSDTIVYYNNNNNRKCITERKEEIDFIIWCRLHAFLFHLVFLL